MKKMEIANLTCKSISGSKELLDIFKNYFYPALQYQDVNGSKNSETLKYKFIDLKITTINGKLILLGRLVKCLNIQREQILEGEMIVKSYDEMDSAPTSFFVLILENHKLLWVKEVSRAPLLRDFQYALSKALKQQRKLLIPEYFEMHFNNKIQQHTVEKDAYNEFPHMEIAITPLGNNITIEESINEFKEIHDFCVKALKRNNELGSDYNELLNNLSLSQEDMQAKNVSVNIHGDKKHPLAKNQAVKLAQAASDGNYTYQISGIDENNNSLKKNQESFSLTTKINYNEMLKDGIANAKSMVKKYLDIVDIYNNLPNQLGDNYIKLTEIENNLGA